MNTWNLFKREVFELFATVFVPGGIAICPYVFVARLYYPGAVEVWENNQVVLFGVLVTLATTTGLIVESVGSWVESSLWDNIIKRKRNGSHLEQWWQYLKLKMDIEPVGQRYLRTRVMAMKFDLGLGLAIPIALGGLFWLQLLTNMMRWLSFGGISVLLLTLCGYLLWDSYKCAVLLGEIRQCILEAFDQAEIEDSG